MGNCIAVCQIIILRKMSQTSPKKQVRLIAQDQTWRGLRGGGELTAVTLLSLQRVSQNMQVVRP